MMNSEEMLLCHHCGKVFYKLSSLDSHTRWKHMEKSNDFMCEQCGKTFHKKFNLIKHLASGVHQISESVKCVFCDFRTLTRKVMCGHYRNFHRIILNERNAYFTSVEDFFSWKFQYENITRSRFVKMSSSRKRKNGFLRSTYFCHRDGNFIPKGKNLRHLKVKGSNKINAHCPAKIDVEIGENIIIVSYIDTHLGHDLDITRMNLDPADRALIAEKLALQVPFEEILDEINNKSRDCGVTRINLLTRKDLWNIVEAFKINPKTVVYSKKRMRRKKQLEQPRKEPQKNKRYFKVFDDSSSKRQNEKPLDITKIKGEEVFTQETEINNDNNFLHPFILEDENNEDGQQFVVISEENIKDYGTFLIINSKGNVENITRPQVVYSESGNDELPEQTETGQDVGIQVLDSAKVQISENSEIKNSRDDDCVQICNTVGVYTCEDDGIQIYNGDEVQICEDEVQILDSDEIQIFENDDVEIFEDGKTEFYENEGFDICEGDEIEIYEVDGQIIDDSTKQIGETLEADNINMDMKFVDIESDKDKHCYIDKNIFKRKEKKILIESKTSLENKQKDKIKLPVKKGITVTVEKQEYQEISNLAEINHESVSDDSIEVKFEDQDLDNVVNSTNDLDSTSVIKVEQISEDQVSEYNMVIDHFEEDHPREYVIIADCTENVRTTNPVAAPIQLDEALVEERLNEEILENTVIKLEDTEYCGLGQEEFVEECEVSEGEGEQWNKKREEVLNKLLNVHSMINNEQQLKLFSNNIISLENVLKSMSTNDNETKNNQSSQKTKEDTYLRHCR